MVIFLIIIFLLLGATVGYFLYNRSKNARILKEGDTKKTPATNQEQPAPRPKAPVGDEFPLQKGSKGNHVLYLQRALNKMMPKGYTPLVEDGDLGEKTYTAVITWMGTKYFPVTMASWMEIMKRANGTKPATGGNGMQPTPFSKEGI